MRVIHTRKSSEPTIAIPGSVLAVSPEYLKVACGDGVLEVLEVQLEGKPAMSVASLLNGHPDFFQAGHSLAAADAPA